MQRLKEKMVVYKPGSETRMVWCLLPFISPPSRARTYTQAHAHAHTRTPGDSPQSLNVTAWMLECLAQHPHARIPQSIVTEVQFSEVLVGA